MITLHGLTKNQRILADTLWNKCQSQSDVDAVLKHFGHDARVVYELILAHSMDQIMDTDLAEIVIDRIRAR